MKRIPTGVAIAIAAVLVVFGICFGVFKGSNEDREQTMTLLTGSGGLMDVLYYRGADGLNFCKVAGRYLESGDPALVELRAISQRLTDKQASLSDKKRANGQMDAAFEAVANKILPSVDETDKRYYQMLKKDLDSWSASNAAETYNQAAAKFNGQISSPVVSLVTKLFSIKPCELYE